MRFNSAGEVDYAKIRDEIDGFEKGEPGSKGQKRLLDANFSKSTVDNERVPDLVVCAASLCIADGGPARFHRSGVCVSQTPHPANVDASQTTTRTPDKHRARHLRSFPLFSTQVFFVPRVFEGRERMLKKTTFVGFRKAYRSAMSSIPINGLASPASRSLALREAISKLALSPGETVKFLKDEPCIWSQTQDPAALVALKVLKQFYRQLDVEVAHASSKSTVADNALLRFLAQASGETPIDIIKRSKAEDEKKAGWKRLKIAERRQSEDFRPVPKTVPPLDANQFRGVSGWSDSSDTSESSDQPGLRVISARVLESDEKSSSDSIPSLSSSSSAVTPLGLSEHERFLWETQKSAKNVLKVAKKVDKAISPRTPTSNKSQTPRSASDFAVSRHNEIGTSSRLPQNAATSKAIQTDLHYESPRPKTADASVGSCFDEKSRSTSGSVTTSLARLLLEGSSETTATSGSSPFSSGLSAGEIPARSAATLTARNRYTVVTVAADGSYTNKHCGFSAFKETSRHDVLSLVPPGSPLKTSTPQQRADSRSTTFGTLPGRRPYELPPSPVIRDGPSLAVQEINLSSSNSTPDAPSVVEELTDNEVRAFQLRRHRLTTAATTDAPALSPLAQPQQNSSHSRSEGDSTLNQISPLPSH
uniref:Rho-GAP domain-containing protein n=1 Tax=Panagrellus redivivus TaxID=6233 RepID=A0A7E4UPM5_PANRE